MIPDCLSSLCKGFNPFVSSLCSSNNFKESTVVQTLSQSINECIAETNDVTRTNFFSTLGYEIVCKHSDGTSESLKFDGIRERLVTYIKEINPHNLDDKIILSGKFELNRFKFFGENSLTGLKYDVSESHVANTYYYSETLSESGDIRWNYSTNNPIFLKEFIRSRSFSPLYKGAVISLGGLLVAGTAFCTYQAIKSLFQTMKNPAAPTSFKVAKVVGVIFFGSATIGLAYGTFIAQQSIPLYR